MARNTNGKNFTVQGLPYDVVEKLDRQAAVRGQPRSQYIRDVLTNITESEENTERIDREEKLFRQIAEVLKQVLIETRKSNEEVRKSNEEVLKYLNELKNE